MGLQCKLVDRTYLGTEEDTNTEDEGWDERRAQLQPPGDTTSVLDDDIGAETEEDANDDPELPKHDKSTANAGWSHLSAVDRNSSVLCANADAHDETCGEELLPCPSKSGTDGCGRETEGGDKDFTATSEVVVERVDDECTDKTGGQEDDGVDETDNPLVLGTFVDTELLREGQVGAVGSSLNMSVVFWIENGALSYLVPTLSRGTDGAEGDGVPQHLGAVPLVIALVDQSIALIGRKGITKALETFGIACNQGCTSKERLVFGHAIGLSPSFGVELSLFLRDTLGNVST
jgi:hypothetical protein